MAHSDHSNTPRHHGKRKSREASVRRELHRAMIHGEVDSLPSRLPTRAMRTFAD